MSCDGFLLPGLAAFCSFGSGSQLFFLTGRRCSPKVETAGGLDAERALVSIAGPGLALDLAEEPDVTLGASPRSAIFHDEAT